LLHGLVAAGFGNDLIFFFNYRRVNAAVSNERFAQRMEEMFGHDHAVKLAADVSLLRGFRREQVIVKAIAEELSEHVAKYVQWFRFAAKGREATHYLFFVSKSSKGHELMTDIMAQRSSRTVGGVSTFEFSDSGGQAEMSFVDEVEKHATQFLTIFADTELKVEEIHESYAPGRQVQRKTVKEALRRLEARDLIEIEPPAASRRDGTLADSATVTFHGGDSEFDEHD
jgi:hypothetical protein